MTSSVISTLTHSILLMPSFIHFINPSFELFLFSFKKKNQISAGQHLLQKLYYKFKPVTRESQSSYKKKKKMKSILLILQVDFSCTICLSPQPRWMELHSDINKYMPYAGSKLIWQTNAMVSKCVYLDPLSLQGLCYFFI